jgi:nucleotide-binding universal stress UspA family protein
MKILMAHDGSKQADLALKRAMHLASKMNASLVVISVIPDLFTDFYIMMDVSDGESQGLSRTMAENTNRFMAGISEALAKSGLEVATKVIFGSPAKTIIDIAKSEKVDMIVVGSHGRTGPEKFLLGSVTSRVVDHAPCDVLVVR